MAADGADPIVAQVVGEARIDTLHEVARQLTGVLLARERLAPADEQGRWADEQRAIRTRLDTIEPGTAEVDAALADLTARPRELRADP